MLASGANKAEIYCKIVKRSKLYAKFQPVSFQSDGGERGDERARLLMEGMHLQHTKNAPLLSCISSSLNLSFYLISSPVRLLQPRLKFTRRML